MVNIYTQMLKSQFEKFATLLPIADSYSAFGRTGWFAAFAFPVVGVFALLDFNVAINRLTKAIILIFCIVLLKSRHYHSK